MLSFLKILGRSLQLAVAILVADGAAAYILTFLRYALIDIFGDLVLVEVSVLFILAGLLDFASSIGAAQFRKTFLSAKEGYSPLRHKESERKALVLFLSGLILLLILVVTAIYLRL